MRDVDTHVFHFALLRIDCAIAANYQPETIPYFFLIYFKIGASWGVRLLKSRTPLSRLYHAACMYIRSI